MKIWGMFLVLASVVFLPEISTAQNMFQRMMRQSSELTGIQYPPSWTGEVEKAEQAAEKAEQSKQQAEVNPADQAVQSQQAQDQQTAEAATGGAAF